MKTLEQHRKHLFCFVNEEDIKACIEQVEHAISVSVLALVRDDTDKERRARMQRELELEVQILRELEEKRKGIK